MLDAVTIKELIGIAAVSQQFGLEINTGKARSKCPICGSASGFSVKINKYYKCYRCGKKGDVFNLLVDTGKAASFKEALNLLSDLLPNHQSKSYFRACDIRERVWKLYLENADEPKLKTYIKNRGWSEVVKEYPIGYSPKGRYILQQGLDAQSLIEAGVVYPGGNEVFRDRAIFPIRNNAGKIVHFQGRSLEPEEELRWLSTKGTNPITHYLFNQENIYKSNGSAILICEGVSDCYSALAMGFNAVACFGVQVQLAAFAAGFSKCSEIIACFDNDRYPIGSGENSNNYKSWKAIVPSLMDLALESGVPVGCLMPPDLPGCKDLNDFFLQIEGDKRKFCAYADRSLVSLAELTLETEGINYLKLWALLKQFPEKLVEQKLIAQIESSCGWVSYLKDIASNGCDR